MAKPLSDAEFVQQTMAALRGELAKHAPHAVELLNLEGSGPETELDFLLDALVREAPEVADQWRMSELDAMGQLEMTPAEVGQSHYLTNAITRAFEREAKDRRYRTN
jgi:hypothetical protein